MSEHDPQGARCLDCEKPADSLLCGPCAAVAAALGYTAQQRIDLIFWEAS